MFKKSKKEATAIKNAKVEKLSTKQLSNVVGGDGGKTISDGAAKGQATELK